MHGSPGYVTTNTYVLGGRVLARVSKMPVQNRKFISSARPDLATNQLEILIPATFNSLVCQKGQYTLHLCIRRWFVRKIFGILPPKSQNRKIFIEIFTCPNRRFLGNYLSKRQVGRVLAKSLLGGKGRLNTVYFQSDSIYCDKQINFGSSAFDIYQSIRTSITLCDSFYSHFAY